jgi:hypothetical protein
MNPVISAFAAVTFVASVKVLATVTDPGFALLAN